MLGLADDIFFFQQKREKRFQQRRARKYDETQSGVGVTFHFGERLEGDATSVFGGGAASVKSFASRTTLGGGGLGSKWTCSGFCLLLFCFLKP